MPGLDETRQFVPLKIAVLTVSDTRELADDKSGNTLVERVRAAGHVLAERAIVKDDVKTIRRHVKAWIEDKFIDVVITTGGTGFTGRDVTPEAVEPLFEKKMDGFSTMFLLVSERRSAPRRSRRAPPPASPTRLTFSAGPARRLRTPGTRSGPADYRYRP